MNTKDYYRNPVIRKRMMEFLETRETGEITAWFIMKTDRSCSAADFQPEDPGRLDAYLDSGYDIARSLGDRASLIGHLDLEYVNFDFPAEPYLHPFRSFSLQEPVVRIVEEILTGYGLAPLHLVTGRGHHFVWIIRQNSSAFGQLKGIGHLDDHLRQYYAHPPVRVNGAVPLELGCAFSGLSLVMEYLAHCIRKASSGNCSLPVEITEVTVNPQTRGREMICLDITEYGDPLNTRIIRLPFSVYLKPWYRKGILNGQTALQPLYIIPLYEIDVFQAIILRREPAEVWDLARRTTVRIPDNSAGMVNLTDDYLASPLAAFHRDFYSQQHDPPQTWPRTYDRFDPARVPQPVRRALEYPNDLLLKPSEIKQVVRALTGMNWHPRHIGGLIRSKYERNHGWGREWYLYDAATRADFYARLFAGAMINGVN